MSIEVYPSGGGGSGSGYEAMTLTTSNILGTAGSTPANGGTWDLVTISGAGVFISIEGYLYGTSTINTVELQIVVDGVVKLFYAPNGMARSRTFYNAGAIPQSAATTGSNLFFDIDTPIPFKTSLIVQAKNTSTGSQTMPYMLNSAYYLK